jgi:hypothetical protein
VLVGYDNDSTNYRVWLLEKETLAAVRDVQVQEDELSRTSDPK